MTSSPGQVTQDVAELQRFLDKVVAGGAPGIITQIKTPTQDLSLTSGVANRETGAPMKPELRFRTASSTKGFVATVLLKLVDEGKLNLEDRVSKWVPWPPGAPAGCEAITVHQLLNHTSGLFDYIYDEGWLTRASNGESFRPEELVSIAVGHELRFTPGTDCQYCNADYAVAGMIIEKITRSSLGNQLRKRIFDPLRLRNTTYATSKKMSSPHVKGYLSVTGQGYRDVTEQVHPSAYFGAGEIISNAADLGKFYRDLLGGKLLPAKLLAAMKETVVGSKGDEYGLGLAREKSECGFMWGHGGTFFGYGTPRACSSEDGTRSVVLTYNVYPRPKGVEAPLIDAVGAVMCYALRDHLSPSVPAMSAGDC